MDLPDRIDNEDILEELLSRPSDRLIECFQELAGDLIVLGAGGKMGPSLCRMAQRASELAGIPRRVLAVSRFTSDQARSSLESHGVEVIPGDLFDEGFLATLPDAPNVVFMTGMKFGSSTNQAMTWAMNTYLPALICRRFNTSRLLAFSSGNVYSYVPTTSTGSREVGEVHPVSEYGMTVLGRERTFEYFSRFHEIPVSLVRLNYATEVRYGVLVDIAAQVLSGQPVDVSMGAVNVIWQGDANALSLCALADAASPALILNVAGKPVLRVREIAQVFAERFGRGVTFVGEEAEDALLNDGSLALARYGDLRVPVATLMDWIADWLQRGNPRWNRPTHFQSRDGKF